MDFEFVGRLYCFFESLFGEKLGEYLWGWNCYDEDYTNPNLFPRIALWTLIVSMIVVVVYYYVLDHPRLNRWWHWMTSLLLNSILCFFLAAWWISEDYNSGLIGDCLMQEVDSDGYIIAEYITADSLGGFALANSIISVLFFIVLTFVIKWWSTNCKRTPF